MKKKSSITKRSNLLKKTVKLYSANMNIISREAVSLATVGGDDIYVTTRHTSLLSHRRKRECFYRTDVVDGSSCAVSYG